METHYLDGFQYSYTDLYDDPTGNLVNSETILRMIPTSEGYFDPLFNKYFYNFTDHLGNVRLTYSDADGDGIIPGNSHIYNCDDGFPPTCVDYFIIGEINLVNNYYPFGLLHNYQYDYSSVNQYKYNGKELQETGMYDYGARMYMPDIGRWGVVDPLAEIYRRHTPYNYTINNPVRFTDPDGRTINDPQSKKEAEHTQIGLNMRKSHLELQRSFIYSSATDKNGKISLSKVQKKEIGNINSMITEVKKSVNDITDMINDKKNDYVFKDASLNGGLPQTMRTGSAEVTIYFDNYDKKVHESKHGGQIARGEYDINISGNLTSGSFGASKEVDAYKAQLSAVGQILYIPYLDFSNPSNLLKINQVKTVTKLNDINNSFLQSLVDNPGLNQSLIYPPATNTSYYAQ